MMSAIPQCPLCGTAGNNFIWPLHWFPRSEDVCSNRPPSMSCLSVSAPGRRETAILNSLVISWPTVWGAGGYYTAVNIVCERLVQTHMKKEKIYD